MVNPPRKLLPVKLSPLLPWTQRQESDGKRSNSDPKFQTQDLNREWVISVKNELDGAPKNENSNSAAKPYIYRVPHYLSEIDRRPYLPQTVSLGPFHRGEELLQPMEEHKRRAVDTMLTRTEQPLETYLHAMKELEAKARACYEGSIELESDEFAKMLLFDGCFVLEILRGAVGERGGFEKLGYSANDRVFADRRLMHSIRLDMIMLENQLPLFVLGELLRLQYPDDAMDGTIEVAELVAQFLEPLMPNERPESKLTNLFRMIEFHMYHRHVHEDIEWHCLEVFRRTLLTGLPRVQQRKRHNRMGDERVHHVTKLRDAGVTFRRRKSGALVDVKFNKGCLKIPKLLIRDDSKSILLNLMAYEQCHNELGNQITSYIFFMDNLIDTGEDVRYLHEKGIIEHWLGSNAQVADMFNQLCRGVVFGDNDSYLSYLSAEVNNYYKKKWTTWCATLKHKYFNNPWAIISLFAAVVLLLLTFLQTFYTICAYYKPPS